MLLLISHVMAGLTVLPPLTFYALYRLLLIKMKHKKRAFHISVEVHAFLLVIANSSIISMLFDVKMIYVTLIGMTLLFLFFLFVQWKLIGDIVMKRLIKVYARFLFLIGIVTYICLVVYGVMLRI